MLENLKEMGMDIRLATAEDVKFIYKSWLASFKKPFREGTGRGPYVDFQETIDELRLKKDNSSIKVLDRLYYLQTSSIIQMILYVCQPIVVFDVDHPNLIIAWGVGSPDSLHYVYVKLAYRRQGIASAIVHCLYLDGIPPTTFMTPAGHSLIQKLKMEHANVS